MHLICSALFHLINEGLKQFRPLTEIEIQEKESLLIAFNKKYSVRYDLWSAVEVARFWEIKDVLSEKLKDIEGEQVKGQDIAVAFSSIAYLLYSLCDVIKKKSKKKVSVWRKKRLQSEFMTWCLAHTDVLLEHVFTLMNYQTRLFFLLRNHLSYSLIQEMGYSKTGIDRSQMGLRGPRHGLVSVVPEKAKKKKP